MMKMIVDQADSPTQIETLVSESREEATEVAEEDFSRTPSTRPERMCELPSIGT